MVDTSPLERLRREAGKSLPEDRELPGIKEPFRPKPIRTSFRGRVIAFDQALAKTGWALIDFNLEGAHILLTGVLTPSDDDLDGHEGSIRRALHLRDAVGSLLSTLGSGLQFMVVYEKPPVGGHRPESSLLAATAIHFAVEGMWASTSAVASIAPTDLLSVGAQQVKKRFGGSANGTKKQTAEGIKHLYPEVVELGKATPSRPRCPLNYDTYDAIGLGLLAAEKFYPEVR